MEQGGWSSCMLTVKYWILPLTSKMWLKSNISQICFGKGNPIGVVFEVLNAFGYSVDPKVIRGPKEYPKRAQNFKNNVDGIIIAKIDLIYIGF